MQNSILYHVFLCTQRIIICRLYFSVRVSHVTWIKIIRESNKSGFSDFENLRYEFQNQKFCVSNFKIEISIFQISVFLNRKMKSSGNLFVFVIK